MDILRGKVTEKVTQHGHDKLSTFGIGADLSETQWRALLRQLIAREAVQVDAAHYNTLHLQDAARDALDALKAWRAGVAKEHNLPAFVIFHDATLRAIAARQPRTLADLDGIAGLGVKKREAYGDEVLRVVSAFG
jgi:ATP-dependent DNA helicase RecQ